MIGFVGPVFPMPALTPWAGLLLDLLLKAGVLLAAAHVGLWLLRNRSATARHWLLSMVFVGLLVLPGLAAFVPAWQIPLPDGLIAEPLPGLSPRERVEQTLLPLTGIPMLDEPVAQSPLPAVDPAVDQASAPTWSTWLVLIWLGGVVLLGFRLGAHELRLRWYAATARPLATPDWNRLLGACAARVGLNRPVRLMVSRHVDIPMTFGVWNPIVLLPHAFAEWSLERWEVVLMHELTHVRRRDYLTNLLCVLASALYWINPLVWTTARRLHIERERACDDGLLQDGVGEITYAEHLVAIARQLARRPGPSIIAMARRSGLQIRIRAILDPTTRRERLSLRPALTVLASASVLVVAVAMLRFHPQTDLPWEGAPVLSGADLLEALAGADVLRKEEAALELGKARVDGASVALIGTLRDADAGVRGMAAWALGNIGAAEAVPALAAQVWDDDEFAREMAIRALARIGDEEAVCPLSAARRTGNARTRAAVVWALGRIANRSALRAIALSLNDIDPFVRQVAEDALVFAENDRTDCILRDLMERERPELRAHLTRILDRRRTAELPLGPDLVS